MLIFGINSYIFIDLTTVKAFDGKQVFDKL